MRSLKGKKILITAGPTWIPVDQVRVLSNISSGELGQILAEELSRQNAQVTLVQGPVRVSRALRNVKIISFKFFDELWAILKKELKNYEICIHAAAVSDFRLKRPFGQKISSSKKNLKLNLVPTEKIINRIKKLNPNIFLVGFKLETRLTPRLARLKSSGLFKNANCDLVVANCVQGRRYSAYVLDPRQGLIQSAQSRQALVERLIQTLKERL